MTAQCRVLITAGPTHEPIDRVRYLGNRSSGRMGRALVEASLARGYETTMLLGPVTGLDVKHHSQLTTHRFRTAVDLERLLAVHWPKHDLLLMAAAVADYRPVGDDSIQKLRRSGGPISLPLEPTPDLLASLAGMTRPDQTVIGFALEPAETLERSAREKIRRKHLDAIVANPLETLDSPEITPSLVLATGEVLRPAESETLAKEAFADWLFQQIEKMTAK